LSLWIRAYKIIDSIHTWQFWKLIFFTLHTGTHIYNFIYANVCTYTNTHSCHSYTKNFIYNLYFFPVAASNQEIQQYYTRYLTLSFSTLNTGIHIYNFVCANISLQMYVHIPIYIPVILIQQTSFLTFNIYNFVCANISLQMYVHIPIYIPVILIQQTSFLTFISSSGRKQPRNTATQY